MQTSRGALGDGVMRKIAVCALEAISLEQEVFADGNLVRVVHVAAARALGARTCDARLVSQVSV